ncbi:hypothetical protein PR048_025706 [Dryococelus australis]|uniref:Uncharacterized protein n=1 Tax=Dryococelus australis TaxID=614101 RepID=A0ABQ9GJA8_9NEOP|nr:hypothetical protein PR048_025706 [Dryococelus australis]
MDDLFTYRSAEGDEGFARRERYRYYSINLLRMHHNTKGFGGRAVSTLAPDDAAGRRVFSGIFRFPRPYVPVLLHTHLNHTNRLSRASQRTTLALILICDLRLVLPSNAKWSGEIWEELAAAAWLKEFRTSEAWKRGSARGDQDLRINSLVASTRKALNWRAVLPSEGLPFYHYKVAPDCNGEVRGGKPEIREKIRRPGTSSGTIIILHSRVQGFRRLLTSVSEEPMRVKRGEYETQPELKGGGRRETPGKTRRPAASSGTIPTCEHPGSTPPWIKPGSPWWEATAPPRDCREEKIAYSV